MEMSIGRLLETSSGRPQDVILPSVLRLMSTSFKNLKEAPTLSSLIIYFLNIFTNFRQIVLQSVKNWMQNCFRKGFFVEIFRQIERDKLYDLSCFCYYSCSPSFHKYSLYNSAVNFFPLAFFLACFPYVFILLL